MAEPRSLEELLKIVGGHPGLMFAGTGVAEAYTEGLITKTEAQKLQRFSHRSPTGQKRELRDERDATPAGQEKLHQRLDHLKAKLDAQIPTAFPEFADAPDPAAALVAKLQRDREARRARREARGEPDDGDYDD